jgi:ornithine--oxo-acid transaminase
LTQSRQILSPGPYGATDSGAKAKNFDGISSQIIGILWHSAALTARPSCAVEFAMDLIAQEAAVCAPNYAPLPIVLSHGQGAHVFDASGRRYLDMMSAYSAVSHGHRHPRIEAAAIDQMRRISVASRAFHSDRLAPFLEKLCAVTGMDAVCPMNTGAEAVETAIKAARRYGYRVKGIAPDRARIIVADGNFHGRTTTIIGFSSEAAYRDDFGPFTPGFTHVPFGDLGALEAAMDEDVCAVLVEPIQGEAGIILPPSGWLKGVRAACDRYGALLIVDEIQSGLGRTGAWFAVNHDGVVPDGMCLGKALGGGILPVSAFAARREVINMLTPGSHGSTFGGNPLAAAVGLEALNVIEDEGLVARSAELGDYLMRTLRDLKSPLITEVRGRGLWVGVDINPTYASAHHLVLDLMKRGILTKETHHTLIRLAPPLVIERADLDWAIEQISACFSAAAQQSYAA